MLRRTKTIVFRDGEQDDDAPSASDTPQHTGPRMADNADESGANPVHDRLNHLRSELEDAPISRGAQESLAAVRAEFRRRHVAVADQVAAARGPVGGRTFAGLTPARLLLVIVAIVAGGLAAWLAVGRPAPEPPAPVEIVAPPPAPVTDVLVASSDIAVGQRLSATNMSWQAWPDAALRADYVTSAAAPEAMSELQNAMARFDIVAGEPIRREKLAESGAGLLSPLLESGKRGVSVLVDAPSASGGFIVPNDRVDVVLTRVLEGQAGGSSRTILSNVRVIAINDRMGDIPVDGAVPEASAFAGTVTATLELSPIESEALINATRSGTLTLVLRPLVDLAQPDTARELTANEAIRMSSPFWTR